MKRACIGCPLLLKCMNNKFDGFRLCSCPHCKRLYFELLRKDFDFPFFTRRTEIMTEFSEDSFRKNFEECPKARGFLIDPCMLCSALRF